MERSTHSLVARAVAASRRSTPQPQVSESTSGPIPKRSRTADREFPLQGFAFAVRAAQTLAIESPTGCNLQVLSGRAWITAEGRVRDVVADAHANVPIGPGVRCNVSALDGVVTVLVTLPCRVHDARFELHARGGAGRLTVTAGREPFAVRLHRISALIDGVARRLLEARSA